jgi:hypothetical protein
MGITKDKTRKRSNTPDVGAQRRTAKGGGQLHRNIENPAEENRDPAPGREKAITRPGHKKAGS